MEKQPIDDLFRRKLHDTEIAPSNTAWATLQSRQGKLRTIPLWTYMAVAASLVLIGSFSWFALLPQDEVESRTLAAKSVKPLQELVAPRREEKLAVNNTQDAQRSRLEQEMPVRQAKKEVVSRKDNISGTVISENQATVAQQPTLRTDKIDEDKSGPGEKLVERASVKSVVTDIHNETVLASTERTLVVSIAQPTQSVSRPITSEIGTIADSASGKTVFGNLLRKVKKLKDGEVFALSTDGSGKTPRRGLGKVYEEVKESIKNNSID